MTMRITIDRAGRVMIPKVLRDKLDLAPGDTLELENAGENMTLRPLRAASPLTKEKGVWVFRSGQPLPSRCHAPGEHHGAWAGRPVSERRPSGARDPARPDRSLEMVPPFLPRATGTRGERAEKGRTGLAHAPLSVFGQGEAADQRLQILAERGCVLVSPRSDIDISRVTLRAHRPSPAGDRIAVIARSSSSMVTSSYAKAYRSRDTSADRWG